MTKTEITKSNYVPKISSYAKEVLIVKPSSRGIEKEEVINKQKPSIFKEI